jgi:(2Fe-2S) ferredoxin
VRAEDVPEIVEEHIIHGRVVDRLALMKVPSEGKVVQADKPTAETWEA